MIVSKMATTVNHTSPAVHLKYAWLITWMGTEPWARSGDWRSIMAIISGQRSQKFIRDVLWLLDVRAKHSVTGMTYYANRRRKYGLPYRCGPGWRTSGSNAWLYARGVTNLQVITVGNQETIQWIEPDFVGNHPVTSQFVVLEQGRSKSVTRSIEEKIGGEPYHRWI